MRHFVHGPDGQKYGPADLALLHSWKAEGRLTPETLVEPEVGGSPYPARNLEGLYPELLGQPPVGTTYAPYPHVPMYDDKGRKVATAAWVTGGLALLCCPIGLGIASLVCAISAKSKGYPLGSLLIAYSVACLIVGLALQFWAAQELRRMGLPGFSTKV